MSHAENNTVLPPSGRTDLGRKQTAAAIEGELVLQHCQQCNTVQYPPREVCSSCLSDQLDWQKTDNLGTVTTTVALQRSLEPYFQTHMPWQLASVKLDCGPVVLAQLTPAYQQAGSRVKVTQVIDHSGEAVMIAKADVENVVGAE